MTAKGRTKKNPSRVYRVASRAKAPNPRSETYNVIEHGQTRAINYAWLTDFNYGRRLKSHIKLENDYATVSFKTLGITRASKRIAKELEGYLDTGAQSLITVDGEWSYYKIENSDITAASHWRFPSHLDKNHSQLIFDEAAESVKIGGDLVLGDIQVSDDDKLALVTYCIDASERYILQIRDIETGDIICECDGVSINEDEGSVAYFNSLSNGVTFIRRDSNENDSYLCYREFRTSGAKPGWSGRETRLYSETTIDSSIAQALSRDCAWLILTCNAGAKTEVLLFDRKDFSKPPVRFAKNHMGLVYSIDIIGDRAWIFSDFDEAQGGKGEIGLFTISLPNGINKEDIELRSVKNWIRCIDFPEDTIVEANILFKTFTVFDCRINGLSRVLIAPRDENGMHGALSSIGNPEGMVSQIISWASIRNISNTFMVAERGMCPSSIYRVEVKPSTLEGETLVCDYELVYTDTLEGMDSSKYSGKFINAKATDGTLIPVALWTPLDTPVVGTVLNVYGAYGESYEIGYSEMIRSLLDNGVAYAVAYVRGGGELGNKWHKAGMALNKMTTITDTLACAQEISNLGLAGEKGNNIVLRGESAGGITVGAAVNLKPEAFAGVVGIVPFVDCLTTMLDPTSPLTTTDYPEFGNPSVSKSAWKSIHSFSPVDNVQEDASHYPPILAIGQLNDARVGIWEPARWILTLRKANAEAYLRTDMLSGHAGETHQGEGFKAQGEIIAFILWCLNKEKAKKSKKSKKAIETSVEVSVA